MAVFCNTACMDIDIEPSALATISAHERLIIRIADGAVTTLQAKLQPCSPAGTCDIRAERTLWAVLQRDGDVIVYELEPLGNRQEYLLYVLVAFRSGQASYAWRLNPTR